MWDPLYKFDPMKTWLSGPKEYMAFSSKKSYNRVAVQVSELWPMSYCFSCWFSFFSSLQIYIFRYTLGMVFITFSLLSQFYIWCGIKWYN